MTIGGPLINHFSTKDQYDTLVLVKTSTENMYRAFNHGKEPQFIVITQDQLRGVLRQLHVGQFVYVDGGIITRFTENDFVYYNPPDHHIPFTFHTMGDSPHHTIIIDTPSPPGMMLPDLHQDERYIPPTHNKKSPKRSDYFPVDPRFARQDLNPSPRRTRRTGAGAKRKTSPQAHWYQWPPPPPPPQKQKLTREDQQVIDILGPVIAKEFRADMYKILELFNEKNIDQVKTARLRFLNKYKNAKVTAHYRMIDEIIIPDLQQDAQAARKNRPKWLARLGLTQGATKKDIRKAYRALVLAHHPDKGGNQEKFKEIVEAYEELMK